MVSLRGLRVLAVVGAASLLAASCSSDAGGEPKRATLGSALGLDAGDWPDYNTMQEQIQGLTATCMIEAGWEYIPVQHPDLEAFTSVSGEDEVARITRQGLGYAWAALYSGVADPEENDPWADFVDPNEAYLSTLSEEEKSAYDISLWGTKEEQQSTEVTTTRFDPETGSEWSTTTSGSGCQGEASAAVFAADSTAQSTEEVDALKGFWQELQDRVEAEPRTIALDQKWASCMNDSGYDYASRDAFWGATYAEFSGKVDDVTGPSTYVDPTADFTPEELDEYLATATDEEIKALSPPPLELSADQRAQLEAILADEVAVALADHKCTAGLSDEAAAIYADVEEKYTLAHEDELAALAASLAHGE